MPTYRNGTPQVIASGCCCTGTGTGECLHFPCSCCDTGEIPEQIAAAFDAPFEWADGSCVGTSATTGQFGDAGFGGGGGVGDPCTLSEGFSGGGLFDGLLVKLQSEDNLGNPCAWTIYALPTSFGCGAIAPMYLSVDDFDCCLESQTCTLTPLSVPAGWVSYPTEVTLTSCGCDEPVGTGSIASVATARPRRMVPLPAVPPCRHEGHPAAPPAGKPVGRRYYHCERGLGIVCKCDCRPEKCELYEADV